LDNGNTLVLATPRRGVLSLLLAQRIRDLLREDIMPPFLEAGCIAMILALILAYGMARWVAAPLQRIVLGARQVAEGKYQTIQPEGPDEVQKLAQAFNEMTDRVQHSQQSQRDFVANVSHELKTPLTSIQGFAQAIMDGAVNSPNDLRQAARVIFTEGDRMHHLVLDLLDLARFDSGIVSLDRSPVDVAQLVNNSVDRFELQARQAQITLQKKVEDMPPLVGDGDRLAQVVSNLVDNAIKNTPAGGLVSITAHRVDEQAEIVVSDNGPGIPTDSLSRIFERFYQIDKSRRGGSGRGVGLGLTIAREIVLAHGGSIAVENIVPQGCQFVVKIPFAHTDVSLPSKRGINHA
jgi:signal transduction histidine kinase